MASGLRAACQRAPGKIALRQGWVERSFGDLMRRVDHVTHATIRDLGLLPLQFALSRAVSIRSVYTSYEP